MHYYPEYYRKFRCIAADCPDSCCQGWDVVIDSETEDFYNTAEGEFGDKLREAICTDSDGDRVFRLAEKKKCPFWGEDMLCDIYKELGEERLCETCRQFPRLTMEFADFTEHSLALACPEAARLILTTDNAYTSLTQKACAGCADYTAEKMEQLLRERQECAAILTSEKPLKERLTDCLRYHQRLISYEEDHADAELCEALSDLFRGLEYIDNANRGRIINACTHADLSGQEAELTKLALYYLYRYYLNSVGSLDPLTPIKFMAVSLVIIANLADGLPLAEAAQLYSKETEQSYENMEQIFDTLAYDPQFSSENIITFLI